MARITKQDRTEALERIMLLKSLITDPTSLIKVGIEYGRGVTDYLTVDLFYVDVETGRVERSPLTYWVAAACGMQLRGNSHQIAMGGGGYSKTLQVMVSLARTLGIPGDDVSQKVQGNNPAIRWES